MTEEYYLRPCFHRNTRRAFFHDYRRPGYYLITITAEKHRPRFSHIAPTNPSLTPAHPSLTPANSSDISITLTPLGEAIARELALLPVKVPAFSIRSSIIMPDHLHFVLHVAKPLDKDLGTHIGAFKGACSRAWWLLQASERKIHPPSQGQSSPSSESPIPGHYSDKRSKKPALFSRGFNDRIIWDQEHLEAAMNYVADNPRRLIIKMKHPDLFRRYNKIRIGDREFAAYGNIFLLRDFDRRQVVIHRADSDEVRASHRKEWLTCATNGGVLVSPFISPAEKQIRDKALELGGRLIIIRNEGFEERFKPLGREFELCSEGRLLLIAPWPDQLLRATVTRSQALQMNSLANFLATTDAPAKLLSR